MAKNKFTELLMELLANRSTHAGVSDQWKMAMHQCNDHKDKKACERAENYGNEATKLDKEYKEEIEELKKLDPMFYNK